MSNNLNRSYAEAMAHLENTDPERYRIITTKVRLLNAEAATWRRKAQAQTRGGPSSRDNFPEQRSSPGDQAVVGTTHDAHLMLTEQKIPVNTRDAAMRADSLSVGMEVNR